MAGALTPRRALATLLLVAGPVSRAAADPPVEPAPPSAPSGRYQSRVTGNEDGPARTRAEAVEVVDARLAREEAGTLGALLDSTKGVVVRRSGGLGSATTFQLGGLSGKRVRFFVDGVPADATGYGLSPLDLPLHLIDRVEIYKGVVPIRFGADALGGAVEIVTRELGERPFLETSAELASFGTFRGSLVAGVPLWRRLKLTLRPQAFFDRSDNDYPIAVQIADERGQLQDATVRRFHDGYQAWGVGAELGIEGQPWADRLSVRATHSRNDRALQANIRSTVPYGDVALGDEATAATLHYLRRDRPGSPWGAELLASYAERSGYVDDISRNNWSWRGEIIGPRAVPGERGRGSRVRTASQSATGRADGAWRVAEHSRLEVSVTPAFVEWRQRTQSVVAPELPWSESRYRQLKVVTGASWQLRLLGARLRNDLFAKYYYARAEGPPADSIAGSQAVPGPSHDAGAGDSCRFAIVGPLALKASYEYATRIPDADELFGDGSLVVANAALRPETSHNVNAGLTVDRWQTPIGRLDAEAGLFYRRTRDLIFLTVALDTAQYQNISDVDTLGVEGSLRWTGWGTLSLGGNATWQNPVSRTTGGFFGRFQGDRLPNLPYLFGNAFASVSLGRIDPRLERVRAYWQGHFVREYFLFWESDGDPAHKLRVPEQQLHHVGLSAGTPDGRFTATFEVRNVADARAYDNVGQQLEGRSLHLKLIVGLD